MINFLHLFRYHLLNRLMIFTLFCWILSPSIISACCVCCEISCNPSEINSEVDGIATITVNFSGNADNNVNECQDRSWEEDSASIVIDSGSVPEMSLSSFTYTSKNGQNSKGFSGYSIYSGTTNTEGSFSVSFKGRALYKNASSGTCTRISAPVTVNVGPATQSYPTDATVEPITSLNSKKSANLIKWKAPKEKTPQYYQITVLSKNNDDLEIVKIITIKNNNKKKQKYIHKNAKSKYEYEISAVYTRVSIYISLGKSRKN